MRADVDEYVSEFQNRSEVVYYFELVIRINNRINVDKLSTNSFRMKNNTCMVIMLPVDPKEKQKSEEFIYDNLITLEIDKDIGNISNKEYHDRIDHDNEISDTLLLSFKKTISNINDGNIFIATHIAICLRYLTQNYLMEN